MFIGFVLALFLKEIPLRETVGPVEQAEQAEQANEAGIEPNLV